MRNIQRTGENLLTMTLLRMGLDGQFFAWTALSYVKLRQTASLTAVKATQPHHGA
jgi:hypothetical protein